MSASTLQNSQCDKRNSALNGCVGNSSSNVVTREPDSDFNPTAEQLVDALDDEGTIAAEESAQSKAESQHELNQLQQEGELPLDLLLAQYGYVQLKPLTNSSSSTSSSAATSSKVSLTAHISSESPKSISPPHQYRSRSGRLVNATGDLKRALQNTGEDLQLSGTGLVSHSSSASSNGNSVISFSQAPESSIGVSAPSATATKRAASNADVTGSAKRSRVLDLEAPFTIDNPRDECDEPLQSIVDLDADVDDDSEEEPYDVEDLEAEEEEEEEEEDTESEETSETEPSHSDGVSPSPEPHYSLSSIHKPVALEDSDSEGSVEKTPLKLEEDSEDESGAFASGIGALEAEADEEDDDDSVDMLVQDADYIPGATNERAIVEPIPVFFWRKYIREGEEYQAEIPEFVHSPPATAASLEEDDDEVRWRPPSRSLEDSSSSNASNPNEKSWEEDVEAFERKACSLAGIEFPVEIAQPAPDDEDSGDEGVPHEPRPPLRLNDQVVHDNEYACYLSFYFILLSLLLRNEYRITDTIEKINGNIVEEAQRMMPSDPTVDWSEVDCRAFEQGLLRYGKNFSSIRITMLPEKSVQQLIHFYYYWKRTERYRKFLELYATYFDEAVPPVEIQSMTPSNIEALPTSTKEETEERNREEFGSNGFSIADGICSSGGDMLQLPSPNLSHETPLLTPLPSVGSPLDEEGYRQIGFPAFGPPPLGMFGSTATSEQPGSSSNSLPEFHLPPFSSGGFIGLPEPTSGEEYTDNATAVVDLESPGPDTSAAGFEIHTDEGNPSDFLTDHSDQQSV